MLLRAVGSRCRLRPTPKKPAEQAHGTALVGEIGADTATIAPIWLRFGPGCASLTEAQRRGDTGGHPRRPPAAAKACAIACNCRSTGVDRVDILARSAPISRGIAASSGERGGILHGSSGWRRRPLHRRQSMGDAILRTFQLERRDGNSRVASQGQSPGPESPFRRAACTTMTHRKYPK